MLSLKPTEKCLIEVMDMPFTFRMEDWLEDEVKSCMKRYNIKSKSKALHRVVRDKNERIKTLENQIEKKRAILPNQDSNIQERSPLESINYLEWAEEHRCEHRMIDYESKKGQWKCAGKKISKSICKQRQEKFLQYGKNCFPQHLAHHCRNCGREIRPQYTYCYNCMEDRKERRSEKYTDYQLQQGQRFFGDVI